MIGRSFVDNTTWAGNNTAAYTGQAVPENQYCK